MRERLTTTKKKRKKEGGLYFERDKIVEFISTGCTPLDLVLGGGGVCEGRVCNIVGDKSTGKTLLAIELCANFHAKHPEGVIKYRETESAFDEAYAHHIGMPTEAVELSTELATIEDVFEDLDSYLKESPDRPMLYVIDSLDALSSRAEQKRKIDDGTYGGEKAKKIGELFRRLIKALEKSCTTVVIVSQIRDNIGVTFGKQHTRTGGRALDFYASQILWLAKIKNLNKTRKKRQRTVGVQIKAKAEKNKVGRPFRSCTFNLLFEYGIENVASCLEWLKENHCLSEVGVAVSKLSSTITSLESMTTKEYKAFERKVIAATRKMWREIEKDFEPKRRKYR